MLAGLREACPVPAPRPYAATAWAFVVGTILVRGSTATLANEIGAVLLEHHGSIAAVAALPSASLEGLFARLPHAAAKSRSVVEAARHLAAYHDGHVPIDVDDLARVPGLGRTGAAAVLAEHYGRPAIAATREVRRVLARWGWCREEGVAQAEGAVARRLPSSEWIDFVGRVRAFAVDPCRRGVPVCSACPFGEGCPRRGVGEQR